MARRPSSMRQILMWYLIPVLFCAGLVVSLLGTLTPEALSANNDVQMVLNSMSESFSSSFSTEGLFNQSEQLFSIFSQNDEPKKLESQTVVTNREQTSVDGPAWTIPEGAVPAQPSKDSDKNRIRESVKITDVVSPLIFHNLLREVNVKSFLQLGCGKASSWFHLQGVNTLCVQESESENAVVSSIDHDYRNGIWYPETTIDAVWAVDFLEYIQADHQSNYFATLRKAAVIFVATTEEPETNRVELHSPDWWIRKFKSQGFVHDKELSAKLVKLAEQDNAARLKTLNVFLNPLVASLPQHAHVFFEHGCYKGYPPIQTQPCQANHHRRTETALPAVFLPFELDVAADALWKKVALNVTSGANAIAELTSFTVSRKASNEYTTPSQIPFAEGLNPANPLAIPKGKGQNQPSEKVHDENVDKKRKIYGGQGDKGHLGGFTDIDYEGISPTLWTKMVENLGIKSVLDIGCGRGISTMWFYLNGLDTLCAEGSSDAVRKSLLPNVAEQVVEHDFSKGPWWPEKTYDAVWSIEFLEHVGVNYHFNYIAAMRKTALLFVTSSRWGGWHHVEIHPDEWWIRKFRSYGFIYDEELTEQIKQWGRSEARRTPGGDRYRASHVISSVKVFINPSVAALPQHAHLLFEHGCLEKWQPGNILTKPCTSDNGLSPLPEGFAPLKLGDSGTVKWEAFLLNHTTIGEGKNKKKLKVPARKGTTTNN